jgi:hypothetical protein
VTEPSNPSDRVEQLLSDALHAHVATIDPSPAPPLTTFETSTPTRSAGAVAEQSHRRFALVAAAVLAVVAMGGMWWATTERRDAAPVVDDRAPGTWTVPAPSPLSPRQFPEVMWTGEEFLVWGGVIGNTGLADGARYDPATDTWQPMASAPADVRPGASAVWAGDRMITAAKRTAHAYDPETDTWSPLGTFEEPPATAFVGPADVTDVVRSGEHVFAIGVEPDATGGAATLSAWRLDGDVWRWAGNQLIDIGLPAVRSSTTADQMSVHDPVALPDGFALWDGERDGWQYTIDLGWQPLPSVEQYDETGALVSEGRLVAVDGELVVVAAGRTAEADDLRIARLAGEEWSGWTVVSERVALGLRVLAAGERIVAFGADLGGDPATPGTPRLIDPAAGTSTVLDGYPIDTVIDRGAAWSGTQLLVVGGQRSDDEGGQTTDVGPTVSAATALWTATPPDPD